MSTSCLYGFKKNSELKLAYNHYDSYPSGWGKSIVLFIRENTLSELNEICDNIKLVDRKSLPNYNEIMEMIKKKIEYKCDGEILSWDDIFLHNYTIIEYYKKGFYIMPDYSKWIDGVNDYLYIINLDDNKFEVYEIDLLNKKVEKVYTYGKYKLLKEFDLESIPRDWDKDI